MPLVNIAVHQDTKFMHHNNVKKISFTHNVGSLKIVGFEKEYSWFDLLEYNSIYIWINVQLCVCIYQYICSRTSCKISSI